ncbi:hypothetical protein RB614_07480 [Phytohabitans sp. ZYX-F-186]|uniref:Secreted protein n=1 Tax=Phytohabitans maris TaxID=3071409 RepID=A0ABU0ZBD0_9ACTN|nr:hypothetical protein [Phytohabitans sp. ZYX-F-186]MDQ7904362.1 hypothetical protein [Phytohabitans sp. ZYX-F-186]
MKLGARVATAALAILTALGVTVGGAGAANASTARGAVLGERVDWYAFQGLTPSWHCRATVDRGDYYEQVCSIVSGRAYQGALIVVARTTAWYDAEVWSVRNATYLDWRICEGTITAGTRVVCFSPTLGANAGDVVQGYASDPDFNDMFGPTIRIT